MTRIAAVLMMHDVPLPGGELYNNLNLLPSLRLIPDVEVTSIVFSDKNPNDKWKTAVKGGMIPYRRSMFNEVLKDYDYVIFSSPGSRDDRDWVTPWWVGPLKQLDVPFSFQIQCEDNSRIFDERGIFHELPRCTSIIEIEKGFTHLVCPEAEQPRFRIAPFDYAYLHGPIQQLKKQRLVCSTSMLAQRKRVVPLVRCAGLFAKQDFELKIGGASFAWSSLGKMKSLGGPWEYVGQYSDSIEVEGPAMFHYNGTSRGIRRVELSTFQAVMHGCAPILNADFAPEWAIHGEHCILVHLAKGDLSTFADEEKLVRDVANTAECYQQMNKKFVETMRLANPIDDIRRFVAHVRAQ